MIFVDEDECTLCGACVEACPWQALSLEEGKLAIDRNLCSECGACLRLCPVSAIYEVQPAPVAAVDAKAEPVLRVDATSITRSPKPVRPPVRVSPLMTPSPLWVGFLPLAARAVTGLAGWWLDRRRPVAWDSRDRPIARRRPAAGTPFAVPPAGSRGFRRRWRGWRYR